MNGSSSLFSRVVQRSRAAMLLVVVASGLALQVSCGSYSYDQQYGWRTVNQGELWTASTRDTYWTVDQGTRNIPYSWLKALQDESARPFLADSLSRYGFLPMSGRDLPVGFALGRDLDGVMQAGLTCSACHTREIVVENEKYRIDGAPTLANFEQYTKELDAAIKATTSDASRFDVFLDRVLAASGGLGDPSGTDKAALKVKVLNWQRLSLQFNSATLPDVDMWGVGRLDALNQIFSRSAAVLISPNPNELIAGNLHKADRPVRPPFLWDAGKHDRTQWAGTSANGNSDLALKRNYGQIQGVGVQLVPVADTSKQGGFDWLAKNTVNWAGLKEVEQIISQIGPPRWPWAIDAQRAAKGEGLYKSQCLSCHGVQPGQPRPPIMETWATPVQNVGTDASYYSTLSRKGSSGILSGLLGPEASIASLAKTVSALSLTQYRPDIVLDYPLPAQVAGAFEARVLRGIWAAAPYLHNGSVPTLEDLLKPAAQRPTTFKVGTYYDLQKVGLSATQPDRPGALFDTRRVGNGNAGHEYGTDLGDQDRAALLEYLKSL